ncbi:hypothetical protein [Zooshikella ganghwensis]|uniref:Uncharacterized protein n=1 Tax=Zooshikella ganghwensis TaxID=202772 RepID=A0A4P9VE48_9GAMM|nr:hypothetical protein [Zooshikella ganghwensis]RDH41335.1 hypothetical protein B9G39_29130 [Zooshikella ganghwensis]
MPAKLITFHLPQEMIDDLQEYIIDVVNEDCDPKVINRSMLIRELIRLSLDSLQYMNLDAIYDSYSLYSELARGIKCYYHTHYLLQENA